MPELPPVSHGPSGRDDEIAAQEAMAHLLVASRADLLASQGALHRAVSSDATLSQAVVLVLEAEKVLGDALRASSADEPTAVAVIRHWSRRRWRRLLVLAGWSLAGLFVVYLLATALLTLLGFLALGTEQIGP